MFYMGSYYTHVKTFLHVGKSILTYTYCDSQNIGKSHFNFCRNFVGVLLLNVKWVTLDAPFYSRVAGLLDEEYNYVNIAFTSCICF